MLIHYGRKKTRSPSKLVVRYRHLLRTHPWRQRGHVVSRAQGVGGDVGAQGGQAERERREEGRGAIVPVVDQSKGVPEEATVEDFARGRDRDPYEPAQRECDGDDDQLDVLAGVGAFGSESGRAVEDGALSSRFGVSLERTMS